MQTTVAEKFLIRKWREVVIGWTVSSSAFKQDLTSFQLLIHYLLLIFIILIQSWKVLEESSKFISTVILFDQSKSSRSTNKRLWQKCTFLINYINFKAPKPTTSNLTCRRIIFLMSRPNRPIKRLHRRTLIIHMLTVHQLNNMN